MVARGRSRTHTIHAYIHTHPSIVRGFCVAEAIQPTNQPRAVVESTSKQRYGEGVVRRTGTWRNGDHNNGPIVLHPHADTHTHHHGQLVTVARRTKPTRRNHHHHHHSSRAATGIQATKLAISLTLARSLVDGDMDATATTTTKGMTVETNTNATNVSPPVVPPEKNVRSHHNVMKATYPLPEPLARRLQAAISPPPPTTKSLSSSPQPLPSPEGSHCVTEDIPSALSQLVGNAIEAMDTMYFATPARLRRYFSTTVATSSSSSNHHPAAVLAHRLCLRVRACPETQTLSITDLGSGMTRADLINALGIGGGRVAVSKVDRRPNSTPDDAGDDEPPPNSHANSNYATSQQNNKSEEDEDDEDEADVTDSTEEDEEDDDEEEQENDDDEENDEPGSENEPSRTGAGRLLAEYEEIVGEMEESSSEDDTPREGDTHTAASRPVHDPVVTTVDANRNNNNDNKMANSTATTTTTATTHRHHRPVSCLAKDIGGFYAALCALGTGVRVGTKSKHDDYYEFQLGYYDTNDHDTMDHNNADRSTARLSEFCITRPHPEGFELTVENGLDQFDQIRGDSGTCVSIRLNPAAIAAGLLEEDKVLKPLFLKIVETTQYTVAFSSDEQGARAIVEASVREREFLKQLEQETNNEDNDDTQLPSNGVADMDLGSSTDGRNLRNGGYQFYSLSAPPASAVGSHHTVKERAKYIPLRLSLGERKMLRLVEACMTTSDYTTLVDRPFKSPARRTHEQLKGVTCLLRGLVTACDYRAGQKLLQDDNFAEYQTFYRKMFEIARRHKIMNPEKMRTEYGKLVYILQDAVSPTVRPHLGFSVKGPIESVYKFLEEHNGLDLLSDKLIETATEEILAGRKSRAQIDNQIRQKERAVNILKKKYRTAELSAEDIHLCLYSICDNNSFLNSNRVPIDKIIDYLTTHFSPKKVERGYSLSIVSGEDGARLSHSHERQYYFALQSLTLWRDIIDDMFRLWAMAEDDLLSESVTYSLQDTGQGMQRVQQSPRTYQAMQQILVRVQTKVSQWVGSSVIHMGDHNVPNALSFIDKYTQGT